MEKLVACLWTRSIRIERNAKKVGNSDGGVRTFSVSKVDRLRMGSDDILSILHNNSPL